MDWQERERLARAEVEPHLRRLEAALHAKRYIAYGKAESILVPRAFSEACEDLQYFGLPVERADVRSPRLRFDSPPRPSYGPDQWRPLPAAPSQAGIEVEAHGAMRVVDVFATLSGPTYHRSKRCPDLLQELLTVDARRARLECLAAHGSALTPCARCTGDLATEMDETFGMASARQRRSIGIPVAQMMQEPLDRDGTGACLGQNGEDDSDPEPRATAYGAPVRPDDPRFSNRSAADWGTSYFAGSPEEFLGEPTEDDHDWRNPGQTYLE